MNPGFITAIGYSLWWFDCRVQHVAAEVSTRWIAMKYAATDATPGRRSAHGQVTARQMALKIQIAGPASSRNRAMKKRMPTSMSMGNRNVGTSAPGTVRLSREKTVPYSATSAQNKVAVKSDADSPAQVDAPEMPKNALRTTISQNSR